MIWRWLRQLCFFLLVCAIFVAIGGRRGVGFFSNVGKRCTNVVDIFLNDKALTRLMGAMMLEQNDELLRKRRYMQLERLQSLSDNQTARFSAVIN